MALDLKHVESFVAVAETRSFSLAADRTHTVQSAISAHITALEHRTGRHLIDRGRGKPVRVTDEGAAFLAQARRLLALAEDMTHGPGADGAAQQLRLGTTVTFALSVVPCALRALLAGSQTPPHVNVRTARSHAVLDLLDRGEIDMALVLDQGPRPTRRASLPSDLVWAGAPPLRRGMEGAVPLVFLEDARDLRRHAFAALDSDPRFAPVLHTAPDPVGLRAVLSAGAAITLLPAVALTPPLVDVGALRDLPAPGRLQVSIYTAPTAPTGAASVAAALSAALAPQDLNGSPHLG